MIKGLMLWTAMALPLLPAAAQASRLANAQFLVSLTVLSSCTASTVRSGVRVICSPGVSYRVMSAGDAPGSLSSISRDGDVVTILY